MIESFCNWFSFYNIKREINSLHINTIDFLKSNPSCSKIKNSLQNWNLSVIKHDLYGPLVLLVITTCITKCYGTALSHLLLNILPQNYHLKNILRFYKFLWKLSHKNAIKLDFAKIRGGLFLRKAADQFPVSCRFSRFFPNFCENYQIKFVFSKKATKIDEIFPSIWHLLHNIKSTVKISSIF